MVAALVLAPITVIFSSFLTPVDEVWRHFASTILGEIVINTLVLAAAVAAGTAVLGVGLAWLTAVCEFPGRRFFSWALLLPLAIPAYVIGFVAIGLLDFTGPLQTGLRALTGSLLPWFPPVRSRGGVWFGIDVAALGDLDADGFLDLSVGADGDDDGSTNQGAVWILSLAADGTVLLERKISATPNAADIQ